MADGKVKVGIIGSQFQADIQVASYASMARRAMLNEEFAGLLQIFRSRIERGFGVPLGRWNRKVTDFAGQVGFRSGRLRSRPKAAMNPKGPADTE